MRGFTYTTVGRSIRPSVHTHNDDRAFRSLEEAYLEPEEDEDQEEDEEEGDT